MTSLLSKKQICMEVGYMPSSYVIIICVIVTIGLIVGYYINKDGE